MSGGAGQRKVKEGMEIKDKVKIDKKFNLNMERRSSYLCNGWNGRRRRRRYSFPIYFCHQTKGERKKREKERKANFYVFDHIIKLWCVVQQSALP